MKWSHIFLFIPAIAASTDPAWWEEIEPFYGENLGGSDRVGAPTVP